MGGLYGAPRILQCIAQEKVIPVLASLGQGVSDSFVYRSSLFLSLPLCPSLSWLFWYVSLPSGVGQSGVQRLYLSALSLGRLAGYLNKASYIS